MRRMLLALALVTAACGGARQATTAGPAAGSPTTATGKLGGPSALEDPTQDGFPPALVDTALIRSGGPAPDGIPAIDAPKFLPVGKVDFLKPKEPVIALELEGVARAYPVQILIWHEIVTDTVGGIPVAVTYCPLCNSAMVFDRRSDGKVLTFGVSGKLYNSDIVMFDRQTESLWSQLEAKAIVGQLAGTELDFFPSATVSWADFKAAHPTGEVLSRDTGYERTYGQNPYAGYDDVDSFPTRFAGEPDGRLAPKTRVVGLVEDDSAVALTVDKLAKDRVVRLAFGGRDVVVLWAPGTASALDTGEVATGRDVGTTGVFVPQVEGKGLTLRAEGDGFTDTETASSWSVLGYATAGPLAGAKLERVAHVDTFWFAWAAFQPETRLLS